MNTGFKKKAPPPSWWVQENLSNLEAQGKQIWQTIVVNDQNIPRYPGDTS